MNPANALSQLSPGMAECHTRLMAVAKHGTTEAFSATLAGVLQRAELSISNAYDAGAKSIQVTNQQGAPEALPDPSPDQLRAIARTARNSSGSASDDCGPLAYVLHGWRAAAIAFRAQQAAMVEAQQPAPSAAVALSDDLRDGLVAISKAIADQDDRAAQAMLREILAAPQPSPTPPPAKVELFNPLEGGNPETALQMAAVIALRDSQPAPVLDSLALMKVVMRADEALAGRCTRGTTNWAAAIGKAVQDAVLAARAPAESGAAPAGGAVAMPSDDIDAVGLARYKVVPAHDSMFHRFAVVAGDGKQQLYLGREVECENMARKFAGAFLDGAFYQSNIAPTPPAKAADSLLEDALAEAEYFIDNPSAWSHFDQRASDAIAAVCTAFRAARATADSQQAPAGGAVSAPVFAFRRKGLDDFCTCTEERYEELSAKPSLFETRIFYTTPPTHAADSVLEDAARYRWLREQGTTTYIMRHRRYENCIQLLSDMGGELADAAIDAARKQGGA